LSIAKLTLEITDVRSAIWAIEHCEAYEWHSRGSVDRRDGLGDDSEERTLQGTVHENDPGSTCCQATANTEIQDYHGPSRLRLGPSGASRLSVAKLRNLSIFLLVALVAELAHWGIAALTWSLSIPYPTPSFIRGAFSTLDHNFYRPLFTEMTGVVAGLLVLLASVALFFKGSLRYLISVDGRFRVGRFFLGLCVCLLPFTLFFVSEWSRHNVLYLGASWNRPEVWALASSAIGVQVFFEEYFFRGYLLTGLFTVSRSYLLAALLSSVVFGFVHQPDSPAAWAIPFVHGLLYCEFRRITGGIEFSFGYHFAWNLTAETGVMPNFRWYDDSYGTLHFTNQVSGWSIGALLLGGLFILLLARFYPSEYTTRLLVPRKRLYSKVVRA